MKKSWVCIDMQNSMGCSYS